MSNISRSFDIDPFDLPAVREPLSEIARAAGDEILRFYHSGETPQADSKPDDTPVTEADIAAHHIIVDGLAPSGIPVLSEEAVVSTAERHGWRDFWMVDPLDGTREFLGRTGEFTVNIALIRDHVAVFGVIAEPGTGAVYAGGAGLGAWKQLGGNWMPVRCRPLRQAETLVVIGSRRHRGNKLESCLEALEAAQPGFRRDHAGSALKFCRLAEGQADFYPRYSPCSEWDTAAGQALVEGAGGAVLGMDGKPLRYNQRDTLLSPHFHAIGDPADSFWKILG